MKNLILKLSISLALLAPAQAIVLFPTQTFDTTVGTDPNWTHVGGNFEAVQGWSGTEVATLWGGTSFYNAVPVYGAGTLTFSFLGQANFTGETVTITGSGFSVTSPGLGLAAPVSFSTFTSGSTGVSSFAFTGSSIGMGFDNLTVSFEPAAVPEPNVSSLFEGL